MVASQALAALVLLGACFAAFGVLGRLFACNPDQPVFFSRSIGMDLVYCLLGVVHSVAGPVLAALIARLGWAALPAPPAMTWLAGAPTLAQLAVLLVATDFAQYWLHRAFHARALWPFHAIHHAAPDVNWTTTFRVHPVNYLAVTTSLALAARWLGFSQLTLLIAGPVFFFSGAITHANLNWTFGPFRRLIASPVFHRWHHSAAGAHRDTNFAPMFPIWDVLFGTFSMPGGARPAVYGAEGVPAGFLAQLAYPFLRPAVAIQTGEAATPSAATGDAGGTG
jgi:sterol desaturase/sphingolipid hydroxylase (fatty acid hydroxylase superfamily)